MKPFFAFLALEASSRRARTSALFLSVSACFLFFSYIFRKRNSLKISYLIIDIRKQTRQSHFLASEAYLISLSLFAIKIKKREKKRIEKRIKRIKKKEKKKEKVGKIIKNFDCRHRFEGWKEKEIISEKLSKRDSKRALDTKTVAKVIRD